MINGRSLYAQIDILTSVREPCEVRCRSCQDYLASAPNLQAARLTAWRHDIDHWRRRILPTTPSNRKRVRR